LTRLIGIYSDPQSQTFHYPDGRNIHFVTTCFEAEIIGGELSTNCSETLDLRYFPHTELPSNLLPMHPQWLEDALDKENKPFIR
jgi:hypothetical protein